MKGRSGRLRVIAVYLGVAAIALCARLVLHGTLSIPLLLFLCWLLTMSAVRRRRTPTVRWRIIHAVVFTVISVLLLIAVIITPFGSYEAWFSSISTGTNSETAVVSNLFIAITALFAAIVLPAGLSNGFRWSLLALGLFLTFLIAVVTQRPLFTALFTIGVIGVFLLRTFELYHVQITASHLLRWLAPISASVLLASLFLSNVSTKGSRDFVDQQLSQSLRSAILTLDPGFPLLYDASRVGRDFRERKLGGSPNLTNKSIFEVYGVPGQTVYLRTSVLDYYDGKAWRISDLALQSGTRFRRPNFDTRGNLAWMQVKVLAGNIDLLPNTLNTVRVSGRGVRHEIVEGNYDTGFRLAEPMQEGNTITLATVTQTTSVLRSNLRKAYLELPSRVPPQLVDLAQELRQGAESEREILRKIQAFLANNYTYTLNPPRDTTGEDYVTFFLFKSTGGYCVQFASAFVILARLEGIPARYATGYIAYIPGNTDHVVVTDLASHAWPEVWIDGTGWTTWEATPAVDPASYRRTVDGGWIYDYRIADNQSTARQLSGILGMNLSASSSSSVSVTANSQSTLLWPYWSGGAAVFLFAAGAVLLALKKRNKISPQELRFYRTLRKSTTLAERKLGIPSPVSIGWLSWVQQAHNYLNGTGNSVLQAAEIAVLHLYGGKPLPPYAALTARAALRSIRGIRTQKKHGSD